MRSVKKNNQVKSKAYLQGVEHQKKISEVEWKNRESILIESHNKDKTLWNDSLKKNEQIVKEIESNTQKLVKQVEENFKKEIANLKKLHKEELDRKDKSNLEGRRRLMQEFDAKVLAIKNESNKQVEEAKKEFEAKDREREEFLQKKLSEIDKEKQAAVEERERWEAENEFLLDLAESYYFSGKKSSKKHQEIISLLASLEEMKDNFTEMRSLTRKNSNRVKKFGADNRKKKLPYSLRD